MRMHSVGHCVSSSRSRLDQARCRSQYRNKTCHLAQQWAAAGDPVNKVIRDRHPIMHPHVTSRTHHQAGAHVHVTRVKRPVLIIVVAASV